MRGIESLRPAGGKPPTDALAGCASQWSVKPSLTRFTGSLRLHVHSRSASGWLTSCASPALRSPRPSRPTADFGKPVLNHVPPVNRWKWVIMPSTPKPAYRLSGVKGKKPISQQIFTK
ncbi:hypothetical protein [Bellilinea sp.]|uniref:hypothetical protein n=1 Tax=Bellilinea sp. TaxID=2838785 RepID=UPI002ADDBF33|nr:hypothetical protein [Bellilinea sp.]